MALVGPGVAVRADSAISLLLSESPPASPELGFVRASEPAGPTLNLTLRGPGAVDAYLVSPTSSWFAADRLEWEVVTPPDFPTNAQTLVFMKDWDYLWYQNLLPGFAQPGLTNRYRLDLSPDAPGWTAQGHQGTWQARALMQPMEFGIRTFTDGAGTTTCRVQNARVVWGAPDTSPPSIQDVRVTTNRVACFGRFEVSFRAPDRYANPFNPDEVAVFAEIETPDGRKITVDGFHARDYYRTQDAAGEMILPQGAPNWRVRFAPTVPGRHRYTLRLRDAHGQAGWGPGAFDATPASGPGYIRVSRQDPRYFEFDNRAAYFPLGHNVRSPSDTRLNSAFPWIQRWTEGSAAYARYFRDMGRAGENFAEVWFSPWSLGLEWSPRWQGYHGVGQFNLMHAWEFDRVLEEAERNGIRLNVVIHNHGKFSAFSDNEWTDNPMNSAIGGYLDGPDEFFTDPRAQKDYRNMMRYAVARWGYSTHIFAWQLWSELNLSGSRGEMYRRQEVVDWHRLMAQAIKDMDPNHHLVSTHVSGDYTAQNANIVALPELDHLCVDAYYGGTDPLQIVSLMRSTAEYNNPFNKPVVVSEFGGAWDAQDLTHLVNCLHAGLWASTGTPVAGTPMFWWWGLIEEENLYPEFLALSRFMAGEDRRNPALLSAQPDTWIQGGKPARLAAQCLCSGDRAIGWVYNAAQFGNTEPIQPVAVSNAVLRLTGLTGSVYRVEFWDTARGTPASNTNVVAQDGSLIIQLPTFLRDWGFKVRAEPAHDRR